LGKEQKNSDIINAGRGRRLIRSAACLFLLILACMAGGCTAVGGSGTGTKTKTGGKDGYPITRDSYLLDTFCTLTIYEGGGEAAMEAAYARLQELDALLDYNKEGSDLYRINHREGERVEINPDTVRLLELGREFCDLTGGALEPAIRPVTSLWDFKEVKKVPEREKLEEALEQVHSQAWEVSGTEFYSEDPAVRIDAGAFAKGFVADEVKQAMMDAGVTSGLINLGGNVLCLGAKPDGSPFVIAMKDPSADNAMHYREDELLELEDISAVTAGIYERCFEENGVLYHHIMDPQTGYPVQNNLVSVTVTGRSSAICDALCTAIFVMGEEKGTAFLKEFNEPLESEYKAYFLRKQE